MGGRARPGALGGGLGEMVGVIREKQLVPRDKSLSGRLGVGGWNEAAGRANDQTKSREGSPAALNNHQAFGSSKLGLLGGCNRGKEICF